MAKVRFVPNPAGFRELLSSPELSAHLQSIAERVAAAARSSAPVDTGTYQSSIGVMVEKHPTRVVAHVTSSDPDAGIIEAHTGNLARALDAAR
jgi:hypothetical protein